MTADTVTAAMNAYHAASERLYTLRAKLAARGLTRAEIKTETAPERQAATIARRAFNDAHHAYYVGA